MLTLGSMTLYKVFQPVVQTTGASEDGDNVVEEGIASLSPEMRKALEEVLLAGVELGLRMADKRSPWDPPSTPPLGLRLGGALTPSVQGCYT